MGLNPIETKTVADFFAGIGLVSLGLDQAGWKTVYALDYDQEKADLYTKNFGSGHYHIKDIAAESGLNLPNVTLAHASFPCTDLSLAGSRKGIHQGESSAFWQFIRILSEAKTKYGEDNPPFVLLENVEGLLSSNSGKDLRAVLESLNEMDYIVDILRINAAHFVPQSRVRIFIIGIHKSILGDHNPDDLSQEFNLRSSDARSPRLIDYINKNRDLNWYFHSLPNLPERRISLDSIIDQSAEWWEAERTAFLYNQLHPHHKALVDEAVKGNIYQYFPGFRRMRMRDGKVQSTVELRNDGIAGCLRTPKGGSARQILVRAGKSSLDARLINGAEAGRLMGADTFKLDPSLTLNQALFGFGDAVCVPALKWIGQHYLNDLLERRQVVGTYQVPVLNRHNNLAHLRN